MPSSKILLAALLASIALMPAAHAQYQWRDANGRMVYSDMPPPPGLKPGSVLKSPASKSTDDSMTGKADVQSAAVATPAQTATPAQMATSAQTATPAQTASPAHLATPAQTAADREMAARKRQLEQVEAKRAADAREAEEKKLARACKEQRAAIRQLDSGVRLSRVNERGETEILDDEQRAAQLVQARKIAREHCSDT